MTELISKNIRAQRLAQGMTQEQLAAKVFTTRQCISNYETGKSKPDYETIGKIAMALGISAEELLYDASERRKKVRAWCILAAIIFFFGLARSLCHSNLLISNATMPGRLTYVQGYIMVIIPATCTFFGWILIRLYELYIKKEDCTLNRTKRVSIFLILLLGSWFLAAFMEHPKIYEAASDPMTNKYGGPAMLGVYLETFYYKYIYVTISQLPILNGIFIFLGGLAAICKKGEQV